MFNTFLLQMIFLRQLMVMIEAHWIKYLNNTNLR